MNSEAIIFTIRPVKIGEREQELMDKMALGMLQKSAAFSMGISDNTAHTMMLRLKAKFNAKSAYEMFFKYGVQRSMQALSEAIPARTAENNTAQSKGAENG